MLKNKQTKKSGHKCKQTADVTSKSKQITTKKCKQPADITKQTDTTVPQKSSFSIKINILPHCVTNKNLDFFMAKSN